MLRNPSVVVLLMTFAVMLMVAACGPSNEDIDARIEAKVSEMLTDTQESTKNIFSASTGSSPDKQGKRADWLNDIKASEAKAKAEREAMFGELKAAAAQAQAEQAKAQQAKADQEKSDEEKAGQPKGGSGTDGKNKDDTDEKSSDEADGPTDAEYEAALLFVHDVFDARYPTGKAILNADRGAAALKEYRVDLTSGESIIGDLTLTIHEDAHALNGKLKREDGRENYFLIAQLEDGTILDFAPLGLTTPNKSDHFQGISRSAILLDTENYKRPPTCEGCILSPHQGEGDWGTDDSYSDLYHVGAPKAGVITHYKEGYPGFDPDFVVSTNDSFDSGDQGYGMLFAVSNTHLTLPTIYSV